MCFVGIGDERATGAAPGRRRVSPTAVGLGGIAALGLASVVWAGGMVNEIAAPATAASPSAVPMLTPTPSPLVTPSATPGPLPTAEPTPTDPVLPTAAPEPTFPTVVIPTLPPLPTPIVIYVPAPTLAPIPCVHPGSHLGVNACRWPHN